MKYINNALVIFLYSTCLICLICFDGHNIKFRRDMKQLQLWQSLLAELRIRVVEQGVYQPLLL